MPSSSHPYDELASEEQALVRAHWAAEIKQRIAELDLAPEFAASGRPYVELEDGMVVLH